MSQVKENHHSLRAEWLSLKNQWANTRQQWRDSVSTRFEREFWQEWENEIPRTLSTMIELDELLNQALRNMEHD